MGELVPAATPRPAPPRKGAAAVNGANVYQHSQFNSLGGLDLRGAV